MAATAHLPVQVGFHHDGSWSSTGISWQDFGFMHTEKHAAPCQRRLPTPEWANDDTKLRSLLVRFLEIRAGIKRAPSATERERFNAAIAAMNAKRASLIQRIDRLCAEYVAVKKSEIPDARRMRELENEIENIDTLLRMSACNGGADKILRAVHLYYRMHLDSVAVAAALGLKPPHIRVLMQRLNVIWNEEFCGMVRAIPVPRSKEKAAKAVELWMSGLSVDQIARDLTINIASVRNALKLAGLWRAYARGHAPSVDGSTGVAETKRRERKLDWERVRELWKQGLTTRAIANEIGAQYASVHYALRKCGLKPHRRVAVARVKPARMPKPPRARRGSPELREKLSISARKIDYAAARALYEAGKNFKEIARELGCCRDAAVRAVRASGPAPAQPRPRKIDIVRAVELRLNGATLKAIAAESNCTIAAVSDALCKAEAVTIALEKIRHAGTEKPNATD